MYKAHVHPSNTYVIVLVRVFSNRSQNLYILKFKPIHTSSRIDNPGIQERLFLLAKNACGTLAGHTKLTNR